MPFTWRRGDAAKDNAGKETGDPVGRESKWDDKGLDCKELEDSGVKLVPILLLLVLLLWLLRLLMAVLRVLLPLLVIGVKTGEE